MNTNNSLAALGLVSFLAGACASEDYEPSRGEKSDGIGECSGSNIEYADWLSSYKASDAFRNALVGEADDALLAEELVSKPCVQSDDAFQGWFALWNGLWNAALDPSSNDFEIDEMEGGGLQAVLLAKPEGSGGVGYAAWLDLYDSSLSTALRPVLGQSNTVIIEEANVFNSEEENALTLLEAAQPATSARGAYAKWIGLFDEYVGDAIAPGAGPDIDDAESDYLERVVATQPGVSAEIAYLAWLQLFRDRFESAAAVTSEDAQALSEFELNVLDQYQAVRAPGVGEKPYLSWQGEFIAVFSAVVDSSTGGVSSVGRSHLEVWLAARPCGESDAIADAWAQLELVRSRVDAEVAELISQAAPSACE